MLLVPVGGPLQSVMDSLTAQGKSLHRLAAVAAQVQTLSALHFVFSSSIPSSLSSILSLLSFSLATFPVCPVILCGL